MTNESILGGTTEAREAPAARGSWTRKADDVKIEFGFGVPLGAMASHPAFHSAWDIS